MPRSGWAAVAALRRSRIGIGADTALCCLLLFSMRRVARAKKVPVGKSGVTPCKHFIHNRLQGKVIGCTGTGSLPVRPERLLLYDLTAGNGEPAIPGNPETERHLSLDLDINALATEQIEAKRLGPVEAFEKHCSPGISLRQVAKLNRSVPQLKRVPPIQLVLVEQASETFNSLVSNVDGYLVGEHLWFRSPEIEYQWLALESGDSVIALRQDAKLLPPPLCTQEDIVHIYADPNHIKDWVLTPEFLNGCPPFTTSLTTLGCNVGGLKRMDIEERLKWYDKVEEISSNLVKPWHDACLLSLGNASEWAYLITAPAKWREEVKEVCRNAIKQAKGINPENVRMAFLKEDPREFRAIEDYLFLTKAELA